MVEFIKRTRQTATNQPIGVVRITNDDGGKFRADMAMANAVGNVGKLAFDKAKEAYEKEDIAQARSMEIMSRDSNGQLEINTFDKAPGLFGIGERDRSTVAQNLYNKRFAQATENDLNRELLRISQEYPDAVEFEKQALAFSSSQKQFIDERFDEVLGAQYQNHASNLIGQYVVGKQKDAHVRAQNIAAQEAITNINTQIQDFQNLRIIGSPEADNQLDVLLKDIAEDYKSNPQMTASQYNNLVSSAQRADFNGRLTNITTNTKVNEFELLNILDVALRDGSYVTDEFDDKLIALGVPEDAAISLTASLVGASTATVNDLAQQMSANKGEAKAAQTNIAVTSVISGGNPTQIANLPKDAINSFVTPQFVLNVLGSDIVQGAALEPNQQALVNIMQSTNELPGAFKKQVEDILDGAVRDERTVRNAMTLLRYGSFNEYGRRQLDGVDNQAVGLFFAALKVHGNDFLKAQQQTFKFATASSEELRKNYAKITQRFGIPTNDMDYTSGTLQSKGLSIMKKHLAQVVSDVLGGSPEEFTNQRLLDSLVPAALEVYSTFENPDLVMKEFVRGNLVKTKYLFDEKFSEFAPERYFKSKKDEETFVNIVNRQIVEAQGLEVGISQLPFSGLSLQEADAFSASTGLPVDYSNVLGEDYFLIRDARSSVSEPKFLVVDRIGKIVQKDGKPIFADFRAVAAKNLLDQRIQVRRSIEEAARLQKLRRQPGYLLDIEGNPIR